MPAFGLVKIQQPAFFAREDTRTPLRCALWSVAANIVLSLVLFAYIGHVGIALATSLAAWLNTILLAIILRRRGLHQLDDRFLQRLPRILVASLMMGMLVWGVHQGLADWFDKGLLPSIAGLFVLVALGLAGFAVFALLLRAARFSEMKLLFARTKQEGSAEAP